jgi:hypothetical protein
MLIKQIEVEKDNIMNSKICSRPNKLQGRNSRIDEKEELMRKEEAKTKFAMLYKELEDLKILEK